MNGYTRQRVFSADANERRLSANYTTRNLCFLRTLSLKLLPLGPDPAKTSNVCFAGRVEMSCCIWDTATSRPSRQL